MTKSDRICVGAVAGSFGVRGDVRLKSFCAEPSDIASYGLLTTEAGDRTFSVTLTRPVKSGYAARLSGVNSKDSADALKGTRLYVVRSAFPDLPDDEFYHSDLIGLTAFDTGGRRLGQVAAVLNHGAGDLLEIRSKDPKSGVLVPFTSAIVPTIDLSSGRMIIDPPDSLFDMSSND